MLTWNVYMEDFNARCIKVFNIFNHFAFHEDCRKVARKYKDDREKFVEEIRHSLMYFFWSKCEYEIIISSWPPDRKGFENKKVDIYEQVMLNWPLFAEYVWQNRKELARRTKSTFTSKSVEDAPDPRELLGRHHAMQEAARRLAREEKG